MAGKRTKAAPIADFQLPIADLPVGNRRSAIGNAWTPEQHLGITTVDRSLLVSAAAGSGKTAMLSERCAHLVCDAPEPYRCDVDELLVVTFTDKAAAEMKSRITGALRARVAAHPASDRLAKQLALADQANVSTLHSFCSRLLRQHFHLVGLDPSFVVMDGEEAKLLRLEVGRELLQDRYELDEDGRFQKLVDAYAEGDDGRLLRDVLHTHEMLQSLVDPQDWLDRTRRRLAEACEGPLVATELGGELIDLLGHRLAALRQRCAVAIDLIQKLGGFPRYLEHLHGLSQALKHWEKVLETEGPDVLAQEMEALQLPRLPPVKSDVPNKDVAKSAIDSVFKAVKSGPWRDSLRFSDAQWRDGMRRVLPHADTFLGLVEHFAVRYRQAKDASRQVDFSDLERYTLEVLRDPNRPGKLYPTPTARMYHRQFKHVLVDEYQDINELQDAILALLSRECVAGRPGVVPNLFCVGDVKQSIYRFRLAEPQRFLQREQLFSAQNQSGASTRPAHGQTIYLQHNFRSRAPLLDAINSVFERLMTRDAADIEYDESHHLRPGQTYPAADGQPCFAGSPVELHLLPSKLGTGAPDEGGEGSQPCGDEAELDRAEREALLVARRIRQIMGLEDSPPMCVMDKAPGGGMAPRRIRYRDIVILLRSMRYKADQYADVLRQCGVPCHSESGTGYFESMEVRDMLALLAVLDNQRQDIPLAAVLRSPLGGLPEPEDSLARIRLAYPSRDKPVPFHQAVVRYAAEHDDELAAKLRDFLKDVADWRAMAHRRPLAETIWSIYERTGYLAFVSGLTGGEQRVANLVFLHERATQFGTFQRQGLGRFMQFMESLRDEADLGQPSVATEAEDVVRIMSVHRSKGLEFPVVVLPDLGKRINLQDCAGPILVDRQAGLGMVVADDDRQARYPSLASTLVQERLRRQSIAEELRVLYVAMTRAREHVVLVGTCDESSPEKWKGRWSDHRGPLPSDAVVGAGCVLDWLGPVASCHTGTGGDFIKVTCHGSAEVAAWRAPGGGGPAENPRLAALAALEPLDPPPPPDPLAEEVIGRLTFSYRYQQYATQPAVRPVVAPAFGTNLEPARFMREDAAPSAADVGSATHLVLEHLDFSRPLDAEDLAAQIESLVARRVVDAASARLADRAGILWFAATDVGRLLRDNAHRLLRELPVYLAAPPDAAGPAEGLDQVMVRGRIDVLVPAPEGATVVDFKTDAVAPDAVELRAAQYEHQMRQYREAVTRITGTPPARVCVVFLAARVVRDMPG